MSYLGNILINSFKNVTKENLKEYSKDRNKCKELIISIYGECEFQDLFKKFNSIDWNIAWDEFNFYYKINLI